MSFIVLVKEMAPFVAWNQASSYGLLEEREKEICL